MPAGERYILSRADLSGVEYPLHRSENLEELLRRRDEMREEAVHRRRQNSVYYRVTDGEDPERGEAEWCEDCPRHDELGAFGPWCLRCRREAEALIRTVAHRGAA